MNGNWFWWGGKNCSPEEFKKLWIFTVSYLRDQKNLHHLLYAYNTDRYSSREDYLEKYPGDEWVDVIGFDIYQRGKNNEAFVQELDKTLTLLESIAAEKHKIPALTEFGYGTVPDSTWWTDALLKGIGHHKIAYALAWRNAGPKPNGTQEFYVPYKEQLSADNFKQFYETDKMLFQKDVTVEKLYGK